MELDAALQFPYCHFALRLWCDDHTENIAEFATRAMRVAVNKVNNDLESDVQNLLSPPNSLRPVDPGPPESWRPRAIELKGTHNDVHTWTLVLVIVAPEVLDETRMDEKIHFYRTFLQERLENQAEAVHLWRSPSAGR